MGQHAQHHHARVGRRGTGMAAQRVSRQLCPGAVQQGVAPGWCDGSAGGKPHRAQHAPAGQAQRTVQQPGVGRRDQAAFKPGALHLEVLQIVARVKGVSRSGQTQRQQVPAHGLGARRQAHPQAVLCPATTVGDGLHRPPFQPRAGSHRHAAALKRQRPVAAVKARGAGRGQHGMRAFVKLRVQFQHVAAHHAARRVHQHVVADARALGVQALQHPQRPAVAVQRHGAIALARVVQLQVGVPAAGAGGVIHRATAPRLLSSNRSGPAGTPQAPGCAAGCACRRALPASARRAARRHAGGGPG